MRKLIELVEVLAKLLLAGMLTISVVLAIVSLLPIAFAVSVALWLDRAIASFEETP